MRKRKVSGLKIATTELIYDDEFNIVGERVRVVAPDELPKPKPVEVYTGTDELIEKHRNDDCIKDWDLVLELRIAKRAHLDFGEGSSHAVIRVELLEIIHKLLMTRLSAQQKSAQAKKSKAKPKQDEWKAAKAQIQLSHPKFADNDSWIAKQIAKTRNLRENPDTIRKVISRK